VSATRDEDSEATTATRPRGHESLESVPVQARAIRDAIVASARPVILTHANPDADAVAAALGALALCRHLKREPTLVTSGDHVLPDNLRFLRGGEQLQRADDDAIVASDLLIFVDCADVSRLGPQFYELASEFERRRATINIDHHVTNTRFGTLNLVVPEASATAEIITAMLQALDLEIEPDEATALLAGLYGDTLGLRTPSTTPGTLRASATLIEAGADLDTIIDNLFRLKPFSTVTLWGEALQRAQWRGALVWTAIYPDMLERTGATRAEAEGVVNFLAGVIGGRAGALLYEEPWGWRVSLRSVSEEVNVAELAGRPGGGGHPRAAGCRLPAGEAAKEHFLDDIAAQLGPRSDVPSATRAGNVSV
jgi:bifunctional oligoribonuclease and PAP phosphatase NrnA